MNERCVSGLARPADFPSYAPEDLAPLVALADGRALAAAALLAQAAADGARFGSPGPRLGPAGPAGVAVRMWQEAVIARVPASGHATRAAGWRSDATAETDAVLAHSAVRAVAALGYPGDSARDADDLASVWGLAALALAEWPPADGLPGSSPASLVAASGPGSESVVQSALRRMEPRSLTAPECEFLAQIFLDEPDGAGACTQLDAVLAVHAVHRARHGARVAPGPWLGRLVRAVTRLRAADPFPVAPGAAMAAARLGHVAGLGWMWDGSEAVFARLGGA